MVDVRRMIQEYFDDTCRDFRWITKENKEEIIKCLTERDSKVQEIMKDKYENINDIDPRILNLVGYVCDQLESEKEKAKIIYTVAIIKGNAMAMNNLASIYKNENNMEKSITLFQMAIEKGCSAAITNLAYMYKKGICVEKNTEKAIELYQIAIEKGDSGAANNLAYMYNNGDGIAKNATKAIELYQIAIEKGNTLAMYNLAMMYFDDDGITMDKMKSIGLYQMAAENGFSKAKETLMIILLDRKNLELYVEHTLSKQRQLTQSKKLIEEQNAYIAELEYAPNGVGYQKSKEHFEGLAK